MSTQMLIAGIDEAGRGALAGPVVAGACVLLPRVFRKRHAFPCWSPIRGAKWKGVIIADSKLLTAERREEAFAWITAHCAWGVGIASHKEIEEFGILAATQSAMRRALGMLRLSCDPALLKVDGCDAFSFDCPHVSIIRGDRIEPMIAAASIIAKVTRDRLMVRSSLVFPGFNFAQHKGYGTAEHIRNIRRRGTCTIHRSSFLTRIVPLSLTAAGGTRKQRRRGRAES